MMTTFSSYALNVLTKSKGISLLMGQQSVSFDYSNYSLKDVVKLYYFPDWKSNRFLQHTTNKEHLHSKWSHFHCSLGSCRIDVRMHESVALRGRRRGKKMQVQYEEKQENCSSTVK